MPQRLSAACRICAATAVLSWAGGAGAVHVENHQIPYFGLGLQHLMTDSARGAEDGQGVQVTIGVPLQSGHSAVELRFFNTGFERKVDGREDDQAGLLVDYVYDFGALGGAGADGVFSGIKPFVLAGAGFLEEDVRADKHLHLGFNTGGGVIMPLGFGGWALRLDARAQAQSNNESVPGEDMLIDYQVNLGVQLPMGLFFDRPVTMPPSADCPVKVVDADGRRDCPVDSDGDGVLDTDDACPGTAAGTEVDRRGCPKVKESNDKDGDGVTNDQDDCPGTQPGLTVDEDGCVVAQTTSLRGVTFQPNSSRLTQEGRQTLDGVAETLRHQEDLQVEIAGHTDSIGSEAYNTLLSQQRADAVRAYLVEKGVDEARMNAVGYGELEPIESNDTDDGRRANRRVEFRITTD